ncbi:pH-response regulator protein palH/rim21 [Conoideocrella luteorostrata]|uniref:PH-response regulator protein palH/rim21 n=1 Tax=Conoideocrella luteorostrata TaxID=1105319 RepID=A0AAJ0FVH7_9HYPO|nr:pH-response regulator protein palH/rim21 [Conoideocrella luteorostrata]
MATSLVPSGTATATASFMTKLISTTLATTSSVMLSTSTAGPSVAAVTRSSLGDSSLSTHDQANQPLVSNYRDPFYASTFPMCYALAATTVTAYMLLIMLFITPRSFLDGGVVYLGRRSGFTHSSSGGESIGGRPWLQKVAALTVAVSLTIATYDTFKVAAHQYSYGVQNANIMQLEVMGSMELRVTRLVSNFFLWLAQAQTLIRLFPRHREKVIIKWVAFALITLDLIFSAINSFKHGESGTSGPNPAAGSFDHPIPALSYMFQLLLGVLYAAWVIYYSLMKKRYAFYHPLMKNMCFLAVVSLTAILIPVVFFILDISKPKFAGWGDYVRWVGAAAASVIVWEWVERIEALEREEKKGGILGREVFDGDDVLEVSALDYPWDRKRGHHRDNSFGRRGGGGRRGLGSRSQNPGNGSSGNPTKRRNNQDQQTNAWPGVPIITGRQRGHHRTATQDTATEQPSQRSMTGIFRPPWPSRPPATMTPVSRTDTPSVASTVYAVRYQPSSETTGRTPDPFARTPDPQPPHSQQHLLSQTQSESQQQPQNDTVESARQSSSPPTSQTRVEGTSPGPQERHVSTRQSATRAESTNSVRDLTANASSASRRSSRWHALALTQRSSRRSSDRPLQAEIATAQDSLQHDSMSGRWDVKSRLEMFAATQADRIREKFRPTADTDSLPVTYIPAPPRQGTALQEVLEEDERQRQSNSSDSDDGYGQQGSRTPQPRRFGGNENGSARGGEQPIPPTNPPLWPGVRRHTTTYQDDDEYSYTDESLMESSVAEDSRAHESEEDSGPSPSRGAGTDESGRRS